MPVQPRATGPETGQRERVRAAPLTGSQHTLDGRHFVIYTDHKPLTFAFMQKPEKASPRRRRILDFVGQFTTDFLHLPGKHNLVADALSRVDSISQITPIHSLLLQIAEKQKKDQELQSLINSPRDLRLNAEQFANSNLTIHCDVSAGVQRPFVPAALRKAVFDSIHGHLHPGIRRTTTLIREKFIWPGLEKDVRSWARACLGCQRAKVSRHNKPPIGTFSEPDARFQHLHIDIVGPLPISHGKRYILTMIDRFSRWLEAIPVQDTLATTLAQVIIENWVCRFGCPRIITTDNGSNLVQSVFPLLYRLLGISHTKTTPYHPASNAMVESRHKVNLEPHKVNLELVKPAFIFNDSENEVPAIRTYTRLNHN